MKTFLALCAVAGLTGCAVYPAPAYDTYGNAAFAPYIVEQQPAYIYGGRRVYRSGDYPQVYQDGYYRRPPSVIVVPQPYSQVPQLQPRPGRGNGDRDGDGIPNRLDRDRNNDGIPDRIGRNRDRDRRGIPNRRDSLPNIPNYRQ